eukprot:CAMPEP_0185270876 /NCGR_PEP_ID=MMETSP1359-20130426/43357_1 /TAXON_ID=552665 /ORGANISM="Bigelowiella longifila, Strain CCMP242" /LENGTH=302 /DNA_ID=CAMNT_0027862619 /DNA_START=347 /DNA_END=1255 /DNA_ORIENTATION=+
MDFKSHKGQGGRIAVVGGSEDYTGAPYYAGMAALKTGAELLYMFASAEASPALKVYSPELMVTPFYRTSECTGTDAWVSRTASTIAKRIQRFHAIVIGPGLGRNKHLVPVVRNILHEAARAKIPTVLDADGVWAVCQDPQMLSQAGMVVLTPNKVEFEKLYKSVMLADRKLDGNLKADVESLCRKLNNVVIIRKGPSDIISDGIVSLECVEKGAPKRSGGIGDVLSGVTATCIAWAQMKSSLSNKQDSKASQKIFVHAAHCACSIVRKAWEITFSDCGRGSCVPDLLDKLGVVVKSIEAAAC